MCEHDNEGEDELQDLNNFGNVRNLFEIINRVNFDH